MIAHGLTPILNVSNIQESFAWFEKLGWKKGMGLGHAAHVRRRLFRKMRDLSL
ncbi:MAG TPA: hypothetical protein VGM43_12640 [Bryobacteraceae bacterium]